MDYRACPVSRKQLHRGTRSMILRYRDQSITVDMPGWYPEQGDEGLHSPEDMKVSDAAMREMKRLASQQA